MQNVTTITYQDIHRPYSIDVDGDFETAPCLSTSPRTFLQQIFREETSETVLKLTHPQPNDHVRLTGERRYQKDLERRLQIVEDRAQTQDIRYFEFKEAEARLGREENRLRQEVDRLRKEEDLRREADRLREEKDLQREEKDRLHEEEKVLALNYETAERFSRGITDDLIRMEPWIEYYILSLSYAFCEVSLGLGRTMTYLPNILVAWYYHRAIINSTLDPPYPMLTQQLPPFLHQKNISAANTLEKISIQFDLGPLTGFVMAHIRKVSLLVDTWIFRSIIGGRNKVVQLQM
ncbi:hypothetical protein ARMGADRAFT_1164872 [Armillaria gallica]|uniref:Uncharacterized protein n=1 Tax=Armillaria gallica TaxID=47427 RepID=A0A2H3DJ03_ARMGA|nr:hypothetical protein ARMGADRAFT_1164872 [Armillaria gallica]